MLPKECRAVRMASMVRPTAVRAHQMRSASSFRGETIVSARRLENRPQRAATVVLAAYNADSGRDGYQQEGLQERVVQVRRVTKVVKGGKQLSFRAVVSESSDYFFMRYEAETWDLHASLVWPSMHFVLDSYSLYGFYMTCMCDSIDLWHRKRTCSVISSRQSSSSRSIPCPVK